MAKNIEPSLVKIGDFLKLDNDTAFAIPEYQRAYSWNVDNCDKLWQDILEYSNSGIKDGYFLELLLLTVKRMIQYMLLSTVNNVQPLFYCF